MLQTQYTGFFLLFFVVVFHKLMSEIKSLDPEVKMIHYWTVGPISQYRNKNIFIQWLIMRTYVASKHISRMALEDNEKNGQRGSP